jgi:phosphoglycerate dehydrogenase-like enzyme
VPATPETRHLVGERELEALGRAWLVNVSRGSIVDETALVRALQHGELLGAGLDVFETEPLPACSPLWDLPNVVITPHDAGLSTRYGERLADLFRENLAAFGGQGSWRNRIV